MNRRVVAAHPLDLAATLFPLRRGNQDPTMRILGRQAVRSLRTPEGAATLHLVSSGPETVDVEAWGPGAGPALEAAAHLVGALDDDAGFHPQDRVMVEIWRRNRGVRLTRTGDVVGALIPAILEQKVTGTEARRAFRRLAVAVGEPAPGPFDSLLLPPDPGRVAMLPSFAFHPFGVERRRAELIRRICRDAVSLAALADVSPAAARDGLTAIPGIGPWTAAEVTRLALGDRDAVSVGDYHLPNLVAWVLAGEPRADDERMLELLEPYRGHRGRVQRLVEASGYAAPRFGPRMVPRQIERI